MSLGSSSMAANFVMYWTDLVMSYSWSPMARNGVPVYCKAYRAVVS